MKILIVDDDHEIAELLEIYVKNEGYRPGSVRTQTSVWLFWTS